MDDVRELMSQKPRSDVGGRRKAAGVKHDVGPGRICGGAERARRCCGIRVGMHPYAAQVMTELPLRDLPLLVAERLTPGLQPLA